MDDLAKFMNNKETRDPSREQLAFPEFKTRDGESANDTNKRMNEFFNEILEKYKDTLLALETTGTFAGILHMTNDSLSDVVKADAVDILYGKEYFYDELLGLRFRITPFSFFQTNSAGAEKLYSLAREYIGDLTGS